MTKFTHLLPVVLLLAALAAPAAQEPLRAQHIVGMAGIKDGAKGRLSVDAGTLRFQAGQAVFSVPTSSITNAFTEKDSVKALGSVAGTLAMAAPYGTGRVVSLFRKGVDMLTIEYTDQNGGFHGLILRLPQGKGDLAKEWLVGRGGRVSSQEPERKP